MEVKKMFYTMGEVTEMFDVNSSLIRYWEKHFSVIKPVRNKKGNRLFTPKDIENFKLIYHLVKERGMTLEGAKKSIRAGKMPQTREMELMDRLLNMRSLLLEVRQALKEDGDADDDADEHLEPVATVQVDVANGVSLSEVIDNQGPVEAIKRTGDEEATDKELFAFYEQNLF